MRIYARILLPLALAVGLTACDSGKPADFDEPVEPAQKEEKVEQKDIATLIEGEAPTLPSVYGDLELGMSTEEAKKKFDQLPDNPVIELDEYGDTRFSVGFDKEKTHITRFYFDLPADRALEVAKAAWGEPTEATALGKKQQWWFNSDTGVRAVLKDGFGDTKSLELTRYMPAAKIIGDGEGLPFGFEKDTSLLGAGADQLRTSYAAYLVEKDAAQVKKEQEKLKKFANLKDGQLAKAKEKVQLNLPPAEWNGFQTRVDMQFDDEKKVKSYQFGLSYKLHPEAKEEILALLKKRLGESKTEKVMGREALVFSGGDNTIVQVKDSPIVKQVEVTVKTL